MKKFLAIGLLAVAFPVCGANVSSVVFNPSRLGDYRRLKVANEATFPGGITTPTLYINNTSSVDLVRVASNGFFEFAQLQGNSGHTMLSFPSAIVRKNVSGATEANSSDENYASSSGGAPTNNRVSFVASNGGEMAFTDDSYIGGVDTESADKLYLQSNLFKVGWTSGVKLPALVISGNGGEEVGLLETNRITARKTRGFRLGGRDIPQPVTGSYVKVYVDNNTSPSAGIGINTSGSGCSLKWVERELTTSESKYLLALDNCQPTAVCTPGQLGQGTSCGCHGTKYKTCQSDGQWSAEYGECQNERDFCCDTLGQTKQETCTPTAVWNGQYLLNNGNTTSSGATTAQLADCGIKRWRCMRYAGSEYRWYAIVPFSDEYTPLCEQTANCSQRYTQHYDTGGAFYYQGGFSSCPLGSSNKCCSSGGSYYLPGFAWVGKNATGNVASDCCAGSAACLIPGFEGSRIDEPASTLITENTSTDPYSFSFYYTAAQYKRASGAKCVCGDSEGDEYEGYTVQGVGCHWAEPRSCAYVQSGVCANSACTGNFCTTCN